MTIDDLRRALAETVERGTMGVPVALRVCMQLPALNGTLRDVWSLALEIAGSALPNHRPRRLHAQKTRHGANGRQLSTLVSCDRGETLSITIGCGSAAKPSLDLVLVGNRGVVRLEGGEELIADPNATEGGTRIDPQLWDAVERSVKERRALDVSK